MNFLGNSLGENSLGVPVAQWLEHCVSSTKVVGSIPRKHILTKKKKMCRLNARGGK